MIKPLETNYPIDKVVEKVNELVDTLNAIIKMINIHEKEIDDLQMKVEPEKVEQVIDLRELLKDPKYWRDQDPDTVRKVEEEFKKRYGGEK